MKVAFLEDVPNVAKAGEIKEVANGYARNFLIPRKLASPASQGVASAIEAKLRSRAKKQAKAEAELVEMAKKLDGKEFTLEAKAGDKERLYGRITTADIAAEIESATGIAIDKRKIELDEPIRQLGSYEISLKPGKNITAKIKVIVTKKEAT